MKNFIYLFLILGMSVFAQDTLKVHMKNGEKHYFPVANIDSLTFGHSALTINTFSVEGKVEKGPFLNGANIIVSELLPSLTQTGKTFQTQISNNHGSFSLDQMDLDHPFVLLKANGYYFNEVSGWNSDSPLTLFALSNLTDGQTVNVNILSHLEKDRVYFLVNGGMKYSEAKLQARKELLKVFSLDDYNIDVPESLNISSAGESNAILLAISVILKGFRSEADLSQLLADISLDLKEDGILNDTALGSKIINGSKYLNLQLIRTHLENYYNSLSVNVEIPDFEKYVLHFQDNSSYEFTDFIVYPETGKYGLNCICPNYLIPGTDSLSFNTPYSFRALLPKGSSLKVKLTGGLWGIEMLPNGPTNWEMTEYDEINKEQTFTANDAGFSSDQSIRFMRIKPPASDSIYAPYDTIKDGVLIEYFENGSLTPSRNGILNFKK